MGKFWLMARYEYLKTVRQRSFLLGTLAIPLLIVAVSAISTLVAISGNKGSAAPLGYVDHAGVTAATAGIGAAQRTGDGVGDPGKIHLLPFVDEAAAQASLEAGDIQAYYVVSADYLETGNVEVVYISDRPSNAARDELSSFLRANLLAGEPDAVQQRIQEGIDVTLRSVDGRREFNEAGFINIILPMVVGVFFVFAVMTSGGYLLQAVATEKENRMIEVMTTSLSPMQLVGGKALGLMGVVLTQLLVWTLTVVVGLVVAAQFWAPAQAVQFPWSLLAIVVAYFIPSYALVAGIMTAIGISMSELREAQQVAGFVNMLFILPLFFTLGLFTDPGGPLMIGLTLFPTTAFITVAMRWGIAIVPVWQLLLSWILLVSTAVGSVWVAARIFRAGMLRYGQHLDLRAIRNLLRPASGGQRFF